MWARAATIDGVNAELAPFARMTSPGEGAIRAGALGRSWILLGGVLPVDYDDLAARVRRARARLPRAVARSAPARRGTTTARCTRSPAAGRACVDERRASPRGCARAGGLQALVFEAAFRWRHRRLRALWGAA